MCWVCLCCVYVVCGEMLAEVCFVRLKQVDLGTGKRSWGDPPFIPFMESFIHLALTGIIEYSSRMENAALLVTVTVTPLHVCLSVINIVSYFPIFRVTHHEARLPRDLHVTTRLPPPPPSTFPAPSPYQCPVSILSSVRLPPGRSTTRWPVYPSFPNISASKPGSIASRCRP